MKNGFKIFIIQVYIESSTGRTFLHPSWRYAPLLQFLESFLSEILVRFALFVYYKASQIDSAAFRFIQKFTNSLTLFKSFYLVM